MGELISDSLATRLNDIERRLDVQERTSSLINASIREGRLTIQDANGVPVLTIGKQTDGTYGILLATPAGVALLKASSLSGMIAPRTPVVSIDPFAFKTVTAGVFTLTWRSIMPIVLGPGAEVAVGWSCDVGTTGELEVVTNGGGTSNVLSLGSGASGTSYLRWLHGSAIGVGNLTFDVQARRVTGGGNINIYQSAAWLRDPADCSSGGIWV
jgi:hypothetical protein